MGNQGQVASNSTVISTSTRNFDNRMGTGAQVYLGSSHVASLCTLLGRIPTVDEYMKVYMEKIKPMEGEISEPMRF
jgi:aconitate hydratase 2/2-methylisocitrate dehydratase